MRAGQLVQLVEQRVPFIVPGNQMYLPPLGLDFREHFRRLQAERPTPTPAAPGRDVPTETQRILKMRVPVIVKLADRCLPVSSVLRFTGGSIVEFDRPADAELELLVNNKTIGYGQAVKVGENFGLRITRIRSVHDTIKALGE